MKTYVKIIILIATLGIGFGIGWFCRYQMFDASVQQLVGHEYMAEHYKDVESRWKQGMSPLEFLQTIRADLFKI